MGRWKKKKKLGETNGPELISIKNNQTLDRKSAVVFFFIQSESRKSSIKNCVLFPSFSIRLYFHEAYITTTVLNGFASIENELHQGGGGGTMVRSQKKKEKQIKLDGQDIKNR